MKITDCKTLGDLYQQLGASTWAAYDTEGVIQQYHKDEACKWLRLITEAWPILMTSPIDRRAFRRLLVKYFSYNLLSQVPYLVPGFKYPSDWLNEELCAEVVEKWVNGEYD